ncbi:hypothetical protein FACS1894219_02800 [Clostridia bacterium]|nr:hypothetical protein FACS1894219_02800 [Clostridia bacterium]
MKKSWILFAAAILIIAAIVFKDSIFPGEAAPEKIDVSMYTPVSHIEDPDSTTLIRDAVVETLGNQVKLLTSEISLSCEIVVDESVWDWDILVKRQKITFYGMAIYAVDLADFTAESVTADDISKTVTITIPRPFLLSLSLEPERTSPGRVEKGMLRFGDIKITPAQFTRLEIDARVNMVAKLHTDEVEDEILSNAKKAAEELFGNVVSSATGGEYSVVIQLTVNN